jgi:homoserine dehydrogenase
MKKTEIKVALLGLGNVAQAFCDYLDRRENNVRLCGIVDSSGGLLSDDRDFIRSAIAQKSQGQSIRGFAAPGLARDAEDFIRKLPEAGVSILVESLPTNLEDGQPALNFLASALAQGTSVVTVDKGPLAYGFENLKKAARAGNSRLAFTGATGVRPPILGEGERVLEIRGVLNGTTNYILSRMQQDAVTFANALFDAQAAGIAEPDARQDIEGWDTAVKILILAKQLMGAESSLREVARIGIGSDTDSLISTARATGRAVRLIGRARIWQGRVRLSVAPKLVYPESPFFSVSGTSKVALFRTETREVLVEAHSGRDQISKVILDDIVSICGR